MNIPSLRNAAQEKMHAWLIASFVLYGLAMVLPCQFSFGTSPRMMGWVLYFWGAILIIPSLFATLSMSQPGADLGSSLFMITWLANPILYCGWALSFIVDPASRQAARTVCLFAVAVAGVGLLFPGDAPRNLTWGSPAYYAWIGSMVLALIGSCVYQGSDPRPDLKQVLDVTQQRWEEDSTMPGNWQVKEPVRTENIRTTEEKVWTEDQ